MAKDDPDTGPKAEAKTPFRRFERLAWKLVTVPKRKAENQQQRYIRNKSGQVDSR